MIMRSLLERKVGLLYNCKDFYEVSIKDLPHRYAKCVVIGGSVCIGRGAGEFNFIS